MKENLPTKKQIILALTMSAFNRISWPDAAFKSKASFISFTKYLKEKSRTNRRNKK